MGWVQVHDVRTFFAVHRPGKEQTFVRILFARGYDEPFEPKGSSLQTLIRFAIRVPGHWDVVANADLGLLKRGDHDSC